MAHNMENLGKSRNFAANRESGRPGGAKIVIFGPKPCGGPCADLPRSSGIILSPKSRHPTMFVNEFHICFKKIKNTHGNQTFLAPLKPQGPRDRACGKEREILFRIALTRALYDQMAPQLYPFYVPGKLGSFSSSFVFLGVWPEGVAGGSFSELCNETTAKQTKTTTKPNRFVSSRRGSFPEFGRSVRTVRTDSP